MSYPTPNSYQSTAWDPNPSSAYANLGETQPTVSVPQSHTNPKTPILTSFDTPDPRGFQHNLAKNDVLLGITNADEQSRTESLATIINIEYYNEQVYGRFFFDVLKFNNSVYRFTYTAFLFFLSITVGVLTSFGMGLMTAACEFVNLFFARPCLKIARIFCDICVVAARMGAAILEPFLILIFPGNYRFLTSRKTV